MKEEIAEMVALAFVIVAVIMGLIFLGGSINQCTFARILVEQSYAEYYLDEDNNRQWRMKEEV